MRRCVLAILSIAALANLGEARETLTLQAAIETALRSSPAVQAAEEAAQASSERARQAKGHRLPSIDLSETFNYTSNPAEVFALRLNQGRFDMMGFFESDPNDPDWLDTWITRLEVVQPVYTGGLLAARIDQAEVMATAEEHTAEHTREQVTFDTVTAFTNLAKARDYRSLMGKARDTTAAHVRLAEQYSAQGLIVTAEVLKAKVYLAEMDELVAQADNGARIAEAALSFHMGVDQSASHQLASLPAPPPVDGEPQQWVAAALERRRDLSAARKRLDAGRLEERVARAPFLPEVAVVGRYDLYDDVPFGSNGHSGTVLAVAKINLFRGGADRAALAASRHDTASFEQDIRRFEEGVSLEVEQAWQDLHTARVRHRTATISLESAREALRVREHRFKQGLDKMIDLLDAETALRESEVRELVARYDLALVAYRLHYASGSSLIDFLYPTEEN